MVNTINFVKPILFCIVSLHSYLTLSPHIRYTILNLLYIFMHFFKGKLTQTILSSKSDLKLYVKVIFIRLKVGNEQTKTNNMITNMV